MTFISDASLNFERDFAAWFAADNAEPLAPNHAALPQPQATSRSDSDALSESHAAGSPERTNIDTGPTPANDLGLNFERDFAA